MSKLREKAEAHTEQIIGQMLGDELLVREGQQRSQKAKTESGPSDDPRPDLTPDKPADQGIVHDERGQEQPRDKARAQQVSRVDEGGDPPGKKVSAR